MHTDYWQSRYNEGSTGWDIGAISDPLKAYIDQLKDKNMRILIPGCGYGHEAIHLAQQGFTNVTVIDLVDDALQLVRTESPAVECIVGDFFSLNREFDLILEQTLLCAIDPSMRADYLKQINHLLAINGKYVGVLFDRDFEGGPPFGGSSEEYLEYLAPLFQKVYLEKCYNSIPQRAGTEVFVIAQKEGLFNRPADTDQSIGV